MRRKSNAVIYKGVIDGYAAVMVHAEMTSDNATGETMSGRAPR